jgi:tellurite methyltransferase
MSEADRRKWDERFRAGSYADRNHPSALLAAWIERLPRGRALDVACGRGRNSIFLAESGFEVDAIDISSVGLDGLRAVAERRGLPIHCIAADLENAAATIPKGPYSVIVQIRYVNTGIFGDLVERLALGGFFICEEHLTTDAEVVGPRNPDFRLSTGELRRLAQDRLAAREYFEGVIVDPDGRKASVAQLVGQK